MLGFVCLILAAFWQVTQSEPWVWIVIGGLLFSLLWKRQWLELCLTGIVLAQMYWFPFVIPLTEEQPVQPVIVTITSMPTQTPTGCKAYAERDGETWLVSEKAQTCTLTYGAQTQALATPVPITGLENFQLFSRENYYHRQKNVRGELQIKTISQQTVVAAKYQQQRAIINWLDQRVNDETVNQLIKTMLFGETSTFDETVRSTWQTLNISHILAISGLHAAIFIGILQVICQQLRILKHWHPWIIGGCLLVMRFYNFASVSFTRIVVMWFISLILGKRCARYHKLLIACTIIGLLAPLELFNVGYYYSFTCAFVLTLGQKLWQRKLRLITLPLALQVWLLPVTLWQNGSILPVSLLANLVAIPFVTLLIPGLLVVLVFPSFAPIVAGYYNLGVQFFAWLEATLGFQLRFGQLSLLGCCLLLVCLFVIYRQLDRQAWYRFGSALSAYVLLFAYLTWQTPLELTMVDIGQGDAFVIIDERRHAFVIDLGGPRKLEQRHLQSEPLVARYLKQRGVVKIESLVISHADLDHIGYSLALFAQADIPIANLIMAASGTLTAEEQQLVTLANQAQTAIHFVQAGMQIPFGKQTFHVLSPSSTQRSDINNHSLVLWSQIEQQAWLFTGDIEKEVEREIVLHYPQLPVDILKVAHHGSKTSSTELFLKTYQPQLALISAGLNNQFNHPHPDIIGRYQQLGIPTLTTSEVGMIRFFPAEQQIECKRGCQ